MPTPEEAQRSNPLHPFTEQAATAVFGADGVVTGWSSQAAQLVGWTSGEVLNRPAAELLVTLGEVAESWARAAIRDCMARGGWNGLVKARARDGGFRDLEVRVVPLGEPSEGCSWLVSANDLKGQRDVGSLTQERLLADSPVGMALVGTDGRYLWSNSSLERVTGVPVRNRVGRLPSEVLPLSLAKSIEEAVQYVLTTGETVTDHENSGYVGVVPRMHVYSCTYVRLNDAAGRPLGVCYTVLDETDNWRARTRLALLNEAAGRIGSTLDVSRTVRELADVAVPRLAEVVLVDLLESVLHDEGQPPLLPAGGVQSRRVAMNSIHEGSPESIVSLGEPITYLPSSPAVRALTDGRAYLQNVVGPDTDWVREDTVRAAKIREYHLGSFMWVPVRARGVTMGVVTFIRQHPDHQVSDHPDPRTEFDEGDRVLAEEFVNRAALSVDNARRYTREHSAALTLQRSLLPRDQVNGTAVEVASRYLPADAQAGVGGDWFDVIPLSGARVALVVGDVVGHGIDAAAAMGRLRTAVQTLADMEMPPDELLARLDDLVVRLTEEEAATAILGASCLYAVYDPVTRRCTLARAGHLPPAVVGADGSVHFPELPAGPPLGVGSLSFEAAELELPEGGLLALYTDGLVEARDRDIDVGLELLSEALAAAPERPLEQICDTVIDTLLDGHPADDVALLVTRVRGLGPDEVASWELPVDPAVVAGARSLVASTLEAWGLEELQFTTALVVSELVTNAIRHAAGPIQLRLIRQAGLTCEVADASSTSPRLRHARTTDEGGRGLLLVSRLTRRWGTRYTATGKVIWAEQAIPEAASPPGLRRADGSGEPVGQASLPHSRTAASR